MRRVLVTGASTPLGRLVTARLHARADVGEVVCRDDTRSLTTLIDTTPIDTVVHLAMSPSRSGARAARGADVITTQQLTAAISGRDTPVRVVVAASSTEVYTPRSSSPLWRREDETLHADPDSDAHLVLQAEDYLRDLAEHQPHLSVAILRLADLAGPAITGALASLWQRRVVPYIAGYDPPIQLLHADDAARAIEHAAAGELAGTMNVAADDVMTWRAVARLARKPAVAAPVLVDSHAAMLAKLGLPAVPAGLADLLRFGRCVDTTMITATGFQTEHGAAAGDR